jgi:hypothetical protein
MMLYILMDPGSDVPTYRLRTYERRKPSRTYYCAIDIHIAPLHQVKMSCFDRNALPVGEVQASESLITSKHLTREFHATPVCFQELRSTYWQLMKGWGG